MIFHKHDYKIISVKDITKTGIRDFTGDDRLLVVYGVNPDRTTKEEETHILKRCNSCHKLKQEILYGHHAEDVKRSMNDDI